jgi:hypothetical protein
VTTFAYPWWYYLAAFVVIPVVALVIFAIDAMPDHRFRVAVLITAVVSYSYNFLHMLLWDPRRNDALPIGAAYQTTWGALGVSALSTALVYLARALLRVVKGHDFLLLVGQERKLRRDRRNRWQGVETTPNVETTSTVRRSGNQRTELQSVKANDRL